MTLTDRNLRKHKVMITFSDEEIADLDSIAKKASCPRTVVLRQLLRHAVGKFNILTELIVPGSPPATTPTTPPTTPPAAP